jgi:uncharacterized peroxidase-related enzyme
VAAKTGFVPNAYLSLAHRPAEWRAFFAYYAAVMDGEEGLTKAERELVVVATSAVNGCLCCVVSHSAFARLQSKDRVVADQVAIDWRKADLSSRERAMIKLAETPAQVVEEDFERLNASGLSEEEIWQIGAITAFFAMSNRLAHFTATPPNTEFHLMGRVPREAYEQGREPPRGAMKARSTGAAGLSRCTSANRYIRQKVIAVRSRVLVVLLPGAPVRAPARVAAFPLGGLQGARDRRASARAFGAAPTDTSTATDDDRSSLPCRGKSAVAAVELALHRRDCLAAAVVRALLRAPRVAGGAVR